MSPLEALAYAETEGARLLSYHVADGRIVRIDLLKETVTDWRDVPMRVMALPRDWPSWLEGAAA